MLAVKIILHPTDFSECSRAAFATASALAHDYGARLLLLHVAEKPVIAPLMEPTSPEESEHYHEELSARLGKLRAEAADVQVEERLAFSDNPAREILRCAEAFKCDLIVMGTHGRSGLGRVLMGSIAEAVTRKAHCPVLTLKKPQPNDLAGQENGHRHISETIIV
jgi:nucleotide-binding universal stress UspA family protein